MKLFKTVSNDLVFFTIARDQDDAVHKIYTQNNFYNLRFTDVLHGTEEVESGISLIVLH